jgi:hypothetical protein
MRLMGQPRNRVNVLKMEEKGSDVNLAVHLLNDSWLNRFESAVVISNDSDMAEAVRIVTEERKKPVGIVNPQMRRSMRMARDLNRVASFRGRITVKDLELCQLPNPIPGTQIFKPKEW